MSDKPKPDPTYAPMYCAMYPGLAKICKKHGYALAVHGSLATDFDLICIPWIDEPSDHQAVIDEIVKKYSVRHINSIGNKPHGRTVWTLLIGFGHCYMDFSFMPTHINR